MKLSVEPYTYHLVVWLVTLSLAVLFGFLIGMIFSERRWQRPKHPSVTPRF